VKSKESIEFLCGCNGGEFVYCPAAKKNSNGASLMVFNCPAEKSFAVDGLQPVNRGIFCGSFLCLLMGDYLGAFYALEEIHRMIWNPL
jgi:hypothetical protein